MQYLKKAVRNRIVASAMVEFKSNGFRNASIRNIAENANISLGNVYRYYANKEDLFSSIVNIVAVPCKDILKNEFTSEEASIPVAVSKIVNCISEHPEEYDIMTNSGTNHFNEFFDDLCSIMADHLFLAYAKSVPDYVSSGLVLHKLVAVGYLKGLFSIINNVPDRDERSVNLRALNAFYFKSIPRI